MIQSAFRRTGVVLILSLFPMAFALPALAEGSIGSEDNSIAATEAWAVAYFSSTSASHTGTYKVFTSSGGGAGVRGQMCLLCFVLDNGSYPRIRGGDLIGLEVGIGHQSPPGESLGGTWALLRIDLGLQAFLALNPKVEFGLRYYSLDEKDFSQGESSPSDIQDHLFVLQPVFRYQRGVAELGIKANGASDIPSYVSFGARYLLSGEVWKPVKAFVGFNFQHFGLKGPMDATGRWEGTSYTVRALFGIQN
jgi:hypothetical protein